MSGMFHTTAMNNAPNTYAGRLEASLYLTSSELLPGSLVGGYLDISSPPISGTIPCIALIPNSGDRFV